MYDNAVQILG